MQILPQMALKRLRLTGLRRSSIGLRKAGRTRPGAKVPPFAIKGKPLSETIIEERR